MRLVLSSSLLTASALAAACYAEWDAPRCAAPDDCPTGFTTCYDGYCLAVALAGVDRAALPAPDVVTAADSGPSTPDGAAAEDAPSTADAVPSPDAAPCTPAADGCCDLTLTTRHADPDCVASEVPRPAATWVSRPVVDAERGLYHLTYGTPAGETALYTASVGGTAPPRYRTLGPEEARCPVLLEGGDVVVASNAHIWRVPPAGDELRWTIPHPLEQEPDAPAPCPAVSQGRLLLVAGATLFALDLEAHELLWSWTEPTGATLRPPAARGSTVLTCTEGGALWRLDEVGTGTPEHHDVDLNAIVGAGPITGAGADLYVVGTQKGGPPALVRTATEVRALSEPEVLPLDDAPLPGAEPIITPNGDLWLLHTDGRARFYPGATPPLHPTGTSPGGLDATAMALTDDGSLLLTTRLGVVAVDTSGSVLWRHELPPLEPIPPLPLPGAHLLVVGAQTLYELRTADSPLATGPWSTQRRDLAATAARP